MTPQRLPPTCAPVAMLLLPTPTDIEMMMVTIKAPKNGNATGYIIHGHLPSLVLDLSEQNSRYTRGRVPIAITGLWQNTALRVTLSHRGTAPFRHARNA